MMTEIEAWKLLRTSFLPSQCSRSIWFPDGGRCFTKNNNNCMCHELLKLPVGHRNRQEMKRKIRKEVTASRGEIWSYLADTDEQGHKVRRAFCTRMIKELSRA